MSLPVLDIAGQSDIGLKRERNEDCYEIRATPPLAGAEDALFLVADGIGGMSGGDVAARAAVEQIIQRYYRGRVNGHRGEPLDVLQNTLEETNLHIREQASALGLMRIGSTIAGLVLQSSLHAIVFNVGDTRVYRIRGAQIEKLSQDQTLSEQQLAQGLISHEEARSTRNSPITAFLGQPTPIEAAYQTTDMREGDVFVLCSDGLWNLVKEDEIVQIIARAPAKMAVDRLIRMTLKRGAPDNVTVVIVRIGAAPRLGLFSRLFTKFIP
ncbi:MAG: serine/threonine-protein phosphatase [Chloroflexi bacterium]|nr:serine/threonine-protein phosphatase [Chloroflexota bacterium]